MEPLNNGQTCWRKKIEEALAQNGEGWGDIVESTLTESQLDERFGGGFGNHEGCAFTLWTINRVYFPVEYDGSESVASVPRNPCSEATEHI